MSNQTLTFTSDELFYIQEMMREAQANPFKQGDYQSKEIDELIKRITNALDESYDINYDISRTHNGEYGYKVLP